MSLGANGEHRLQMARNRSDAFSSSLQRTRSNLSHSRQLPKIPQMNPNGFEIWHCDLLTSATFTAFFGDETAAEDGHTVLTKVLVFS